MYLRKFIFVCLLFFAIQSISAQTSKFQFGVRGGLNLSTAIVHDGNSKFKPGYHIGGTVDYLFSPKFELQSGLGFSQTGSIIDDFDIGSYNCGKPDHTFTFNSLYLKLPLYIAYRKDISDNLNFNIGLGPYFGYGIVGKTKRTLNDAAGITKKEWDIFDKSEIETLNKFDFGAGCKLDIGYNKFILGAGFESGLINVINKKYSQEMKYRNVNISISVGYKF
jgi:hypothetical protein